MLSKEEKKQAINKAKERKSSLGVFAVRCISSGRVWVGSSRNLDAAKNGIWFALSHLSHLDKALQQEWNAHGESTFTYEVLEKLEDDVHPLAISDLLKEKRTHLDRSSQRNATALALWAGLGGKLGTNA